jgi:NADPH2:quinone reductase
MSGVGLAAVQIAKALGASVIIGTVGSDDKADVVRAAGATHVLNYSTEKEWSQRVLEITNKRGVGIPLHDTHSQHETYSLIVSSCTNC